MFILAMCGVLITMGVALIRAYQGPTLYDRILAVNMFGTKAIIFIAIYGFMTDRPEFLDIALVYTLLNFISILAVLKFIEFKGLNDAAAEPDRKGDV